MGGNFPDGVTGNEFAVAGPDYEREVEEPCPDCDEVAVVEQGYRGDYWRVCLSCSWQSDVERDDEPDPDRAHDEAVERRLFGDNR